MKKKNKNKTSNKHITPVLPQNILPVGERVFENKNIYIHQKVYAQIHKFAANKTENEHGGILVGRILNEMGKENTIIEGFIEAKYNAATPTTLTFTHETWDYFHSELARKHKDKKIVGWIHTHPNFGIFLSENDRFIQQNFFTDANQVAYVVDPIQNDEGFFFWIDEKLERCPGFYLYDKIGTKIKQQQVWQNEDDEIEPMKKTSSGYLFKVIVTLVLIANIFTLISQSAKIKSLERELGAMGQALNQYNAVIYQKILPLIMEQENIQNDTEETPAEEADNEEISQPEEVSEQEEETDTQTEDTGGNQ